jgi:hypothetical protein
MFFQHWLDDNDDYDRKIGPMSHWLEDDMEELVITKELELNFLTKVTRVEVIDQNGRSYINWDKNNSVTYSLQDQNRTLKIFIKRTDGKK